MATNETHLAFDKESPSKSVKEYSHHKGESRSQAGTPRGNRRRDIDDDEYFANNANFDRDREIILEKMGKLLRSEVIEKEEVI